LFLPIRQVTVALRVSRGEARMTPSGQALRTRPQTSTVGCNLL